MSLADDLRSACPGLKLQELLSRHTSFAIGGPADYYADVETISVLAALRHAASAHKLPVYFIGAGSNILVSDRGIRGLVIHLQGEFRRIEFAGTSVNVGAAAWMPTLAKQAAERGLGGVEPLIGVPGTIGGGLVMNAGTREGSLGDVVVSVEVLGDRNIKETWPKDMCRFTYRHSSLEGQWVLGANLVLKSDDSASIINRIETLLRYRTRTQPLATSNCGSVFKNPAEGPAAQWIERAGFKGMVVGGARVSERHANFIINENQAQANDVKALIDEIQKKVWDQYHVRLEPEVKLVGEW